MARPHALRPGHLDRAGPQAGHLTLLATTVAESRTLGLGLLAGGAALAVVAALLDRRRRAYADVATTPAAAVSAGRNEVKGRAWVADPLRSHRTQTATFWWHYELEEERTHTRTVTSTDSQGRSHSRTETYRQWHQIDEQHDQAAAFEVVDPTGSVRVRLGGARVVARELQHDTFEDDSRLPEGFLRKLFDNRTGRYRETETGIAVGDTLFVVGDAVLDGATAVPVLTGALVSTRSEESHTGRLGAIVALVAVLAVGGTGIGTGLALTPREATPGSIAAGVAVPTMGLLVAWTVTTYNRLRLLGQNLERSWSLIDVQLGRRHDLIPALVAAVGAHAAHERALLEAAGDRWTTGQRRAAPGLSSEALAQTGALRSVLARAEAYPELTADDSFLNLQRELADTESRIAGARAFYNDTLTLLRTRRQAFPAVLVARLVPVSGRELIPAEGFERTVTPLDHAFG